MKVPGSTSPVCARRMLARGCSARLHSAGVLDQRYLATTSITCTYSRRMRRVVGLAAVSLCAVALVGCGSAVDKASTPASTGQPAIAAADVDPSQADQIAEIIAEINAAHPLTAEQQATAQHAIAAYVAISAGELGDKDLVKNNTEMLIAELEDQFQLSFSNDEVQQLSQELLRAVGE